MTAYATRQQHGQELRQTVIRVPPELIAWYRDYARSHDPPISQALAMRQALEDFKEINNGPTKDHRQPDRAIPASTSARNRS